MVRANCAFVSRATSPNCRMVSMNCVFVSRATVAASQRVRQHDAEEMFRLRRHISQDDTINTGSYEDLSSAMGRVELPAQVRDSGIDIILILSDFSKRREQNLYIKL